MMAEARHGKLTTAEGIHIAYQWSYANAAARTGATGFVAADVGKLALQSDDNSLWMLTVTTPTWLFIGGGTGPVGLPGYTVATLPAGTQGDVAFVTDATAPTFLATVTGGGAVVTPVFYDGTNWVVA